MLALWLRSRHGTDTLLLRTAPAYSTGPRLKWFALDTSDGLAFSCFVKFHPQVRADLVPWREDVAFDATAASVELGGLPVPVRTVTPANPPLSRDMTDRERRNYDAVAERDYRAKALLHWQSGPYAFRFAAGPTPPLLRRLGVLKSHRSVYLLDHYTIPGAYRLVGLRLPFALVAALAAILPLATLPRAFRWRRTRRRLRARLCPACAYDLRSSPDRCPECGRPVVPQETDRAHQSIPCLLVTWPARTPRRQLLRTIGVVAATLIVALLVVRAAEPLPPPVGYVTEALRRELDAQLATIGRRVERLRAAGDSAGAERLSAHLGALRARAAGAPAPPGEAPQLHAVSLVYNDAAVSVTATDHPIVLALCASKPAAWRLRVAPQVRLARILLEGTPGQKVIDAPAGIPIENHTNNADGDLLPETAEDNERIRQHSNRLRQRTGLEVRTYLVFGGGFVRLPVVVGPSNPYWHVQSVLSDARPEYVTAAEEERAADRATLASLRVTAPWRRLIDTPPASIPPQEFPFYRPGATEWCVAEFDVDGPIAPTIRPVAGADCTEPAFPSAAPTWYRSGGGRDDLGVFDAERKAFVRVRLAAGAMPRGENTTPVGATALDPRRRRMMILMEYGYLYAYSLDTGAMQPTRQIGGRPGRRSITYSAHDDCFYALGPALGRDQTVMTITRIDPDGTPRWQIPLAERVCGPSTVADLYAVNQYLVLHTPPLPDPLDPEAPATPRCVVLDPATNTVLYSGPIAPHAGDVQERPLTPTLSTDTRSG